VAKLRAQRSVQPASRPKGPAPLQQPLPDWVDADQIGAAPKVDSGWV